jgi:small subunit ribosomal protein S2
MRRFIFTERNGIHIIDLRKTFERLIAAQKIARQLVLAGERVLFVCTKPQLRGIVEEDAAESQSLFVTERWLGGMLTNFQTIRRQIRRLKELERGQEENAFEFYTKKERLLLERERLKLEKYFSGVKDMTRLPGAVFVVDARREAIAVKEAHRLGIPIIAIADTNADPDLIDYPIPGNDDAIRSVSLISGAIAEAVSQARKEVPEEELRRVEDLEATTYSTETGEKAAAVEQHPRRRARRRPRPGMIAKRQQGSTDTGSSRRARKARVPVAKPRRAAPAPSPGKAPAKSSASRPAPQPPSRIRRAPPQPVASRPD